MGKVYILHQRPRLLQSQWINFKFCLAIPIDVSNRSPNLFVIYSLANDTTYKTFIAWGVIKSESFVLFEKLINYALLCIQEYKKMCTLIGAEMVKAQHFIGCKDTFLYVNSCFLLNTHTYTHTHTHKYIYIYIWNHVLWCLVLINLALHHFYISVINVCMHVGWNGYITCMTDHEYENK